MFNRYILTYCLYLVVWEWQTMWSKDLSVRCLITSKLMGIFSAAVYVCSILHFILRDHCFRYVVTASYTIEK